MIDEIKLLPFPFVQDYQGGQGAYPQQQSGYAGQNGGYNQGGGDNYANNNGGGYGQSNYGPNYAEGKELYVYGQTPKKVRFYPDKYQSSGYNNGQNNNNNYGQQQGYGQSTDYAANSPTSVTLSTGYKSQSQSTSSSPTSNSSWKPVPGSSYYGYQ